MKVEVVESLADLQARAAEWAALYRRLPTAGLFASPEWALHWLHSFAPSERLHCTFVSDHNGLQAVFPLAPATTRWRRVPVRAMVACTNAHSVRAALLHDPAGAPAAAAAWWRALRERKGWDLLLLDGCDAPGTGPVLPPLPDELPVERWLHSSLPVRGAWTDHLAGRSRDLRRNLRRAETDLARLGAVHFDLFDQDAEQVFALWTEVDRASWKADRGETVDSDAQTTAYYRGMLHLLSRAGRLRAGVLRLDDRPIAVVVCAQDKGVLYTLKTAMREDLSSARLSLGALVMARLLQAAWSRRDVALVDFVSKQAYTDRWTTDARAFERRAVIAGSWRGRLAAVLERAAQRVHNPLAVVEPSRS
ncbi:GNAT family N-acetyltransferase [Aquabacterium sp. J223]|uniref:GNAT family N-acetyltransferase n=1 Tax=Aquabacterium sp. J223 TaxID=2898431 RepID=UPI0021AD9BC5|nr:GNAT family N-acetyltransferase [Aquabacterium sp. J223]UUX94800.1 GNAT family N-acetyltransferase [Aquabacterium sp. J223]